ncbi:MAG: VCBS repeat-containing protein [Pseudomonadota bacterium]
MASGAPRRLLRAWRGIARGAALALVSLAGGAAAAEIVAARYTDPTTRYAHAVLGDAIEHAGLEVTLEDGTTAKVFWRNTIVFEDTAPRLADVTGDGSPEVIVAESHENRGARLAIYGLVDGTLKLIAANEFIGTRFRWLAIVGAADLDGDGLIDVAYVDRPHLAKTLRVWQVIPLDATTTQLAERAALPGVTNHRIGEVDIAGGIRTCAGSVPEMIVADAGWSRLLAVTFDGTDLTARDIGPHRGRASFADAMDC